MGVLDRLGFLFIFIFWGKFEFVLSSSKLSWRNASLALVSHEVSFVCLFFSILFCVFNSVLNEIG